MSWHSDETGKSEHPYSWITLQLKSCHRSAITGVRTRAALEFFFSGGGNLSAYIPKKSSLWAKTVRIVMTLKNMVGR